LPKKAEESTDTANEAERREKGWRHRMITSMNPEKKCVNAAGEPVFCSEAGAVPADEAQDPAPAHSRLKVARTSLPKAAEESTDTANEAEHRKPGWRHRMNTSLNPEKKCVNAAGDPVFCSEAGAVPADEGQDPAPAHSRLKVARTSVPKAAEESTDTADESTDTAISADEAQESAPAHWRLKVAKSAEAPLSSPMSPPTPPMEPGWRHRILTTANPEKRCRNSKGEPTFCSVAGAIGRDATEMPAAPPSPPVQPGWRHRVITSVHPAKKCVNAKGKPTFCSEAGATPALVGESQPWDAPASKALTPARLFE